MQSRPLQPSQPRPMPSMPSFNKPVAIILWFLACITTWQLFSALAPEMDWRWRLGSAVLAQAIFTWMERPVLRGRPNKMSGVTLLIDTFINAGGIFPFALRVSATPSAQMVSAALKLAPEISPVAAALLSLLFGFLLAAAPEAVWRWKE